MGCIVKVTLIFSNVFKCTGLILNNLHGQLITVGVILCMHMMMSIELLSFTILSYEYPYHTNMIVPLHNLVHVCTYTNVAMNTSLILHVCTAINLIVHGDSLTER